MHQQPRAILLVEDEAILSMAAAKTLRKFGYDVLTANTGEQGIRTATGDQSVDLVLMDINLGKGIDGTVAAQQILLQRTIPIVFLTSHSEREMVEKVRGITRYGYVIKNSGDFVLQSSIEMAFELFDSNTQLKNELTEHREAAEALSTSELRYRRLFESAKYGILILDAETGMIVDANPFLIDMLGYTHAQFKGKTIWELGFLKDIIANEDNFQELQQKGYIRYEDMPLETINGCRINVEFISNVYLVDHKKVIQCNIRDITERIKEEEQTRRNEKRLRTLVDLLQHRANTTQEFLDNALNDAIKLTESTFGYIYFYYEDRKEFVLNTWSKDVMKECMVVNPQTCYELDTTGLWGEAVRQRKPIIVNDFQADHPFKKGYPDGHAHLSNFMTVPIFRENCIVAVIGVANKASAYNGADELQLTLLMDAVWKSVDIVRGDEVLREREQSYRTLADSGQALVWASGTDKLCTYFNRIWLEFSGRTLEQEMGNGWMEGVHVDDRRHCLDVYGGSFDRREKFSLEYRLRRHDGEYRWILDDGCPRYDSKGNFIGYLGHCLDITVHKQAESASEAVLEDLKVHQTELKMQNEELRLGQAELNDARARYFDLYDLAPVAYVTVNEQDVIQEANLTAATMLGRARSELIRHPITKLILKEDQDIYYLHRKHLLETGVRQACELRMLGQDGAEFWAGLESLGVRDASGSTYYRIAISDVTDRKRAEDALQKAHDGMEKRVAERTEELQQTNTALVDEALVRKHIEEALTASEVRYRRLFESAEDGILILDANTGMIVDVNPFLTKLLGFVKVELCGRKLWEIGLFKDLIANEEKFLDLQKEGYIRYEDMPLETKDGRHIAVEFVSNVYLVDHKKVIQCNIRDISERKQLQEVLRKSELKHRLVFEGASDAIFVHGQQGDVLEVNLKACEQLGYTRAELLSAATALVDSPAESLHVPDRISSLREHGQLSYEVVHRRKDGSRVPTEVNSRMIVWDGQPAMMSICRDITERKEAEDKIAGLLQEKELLLKEVHHRIKNNMTMICALLSMQADTLKDPGAIAALKDAESRVLAMMSLYDKLYRSSGFRQISLNEYLTPLIDEIIDNFANREKIAIEKHIGEFELDAKILIPLGILVNELLTNIMKYAFDGRDGGTITINASIKEKQVTVTVQDDGVGIPESVDIGTSTGFGLQLVDMLTKQLEGTIRIERGMGTTIVLEFEG